MEDPFDSVINAENSVYEAGFEEGMKHGKMEGRIDGFRTGQHKGLEFGDEMGFYLGFSEQMLTLLTAASSDTKLPRLLSALIDAVKRLEYLNFGSSAYLEAVSKVRSRFKQEMQKLVEELPHHFSFNFPGSSLHKTKIKFCDNLIAKLQKSFEPLLVKWTDMIGWWKLIEASLLLHRVGSILKLPECEVLHYSLSQLSF